MLFKRVPNLEIKQKFCREKTVKPTDISLSRALDKRSQGVSGDIKIILNSSWSTHDLDVIII